MFTARTAMPVVTHVHDPLYGGYDYDWTYPDEAQGKIKFDTFDKTNAGEIDLVGADVMQLDEFKLPAPEGAAPVTSSN